LQLTPRGRDFRHPQATRREILEQFLVESVVVTGVGGVIGIGVGIGLSALATTIAPSFGDTFEGFTPVVSILSIATSFAISLAIGLLSAAIQPTAPPGPPSTPSDTSNTRSRSNAA
jgi:ABC-type antimicrobial peptide transport system permease subunit